MFQFFTDAVSYMEGEHQEHPYRNNISDSDAYDNHLNNLLNPENFETPHNPFSGPHK